MIYTLSFVFGLFEAFLYTNYYKQVIDFCWINILLQIIIFTIQNIVLTFVISYIICLFVDKNKTQKKVNKFFYFLFLIINEFLCQSGRIKVNFKNKHLLDKKQKYILICNHRSRFDSMIIANEFQDVNMCFISKPENFKIPIVGSVIHKCGYLPIDREDNRSALKTILKASEFIKNNDVWYGVFPEGTRNKQAKGMLDFKSGCLKISQKTGCPICVLTIKNTNKISKNSPFKTTTVDIEVVDIIDSSIFKTHQTVEVGNMIKEKMLKSLND